MKKQKSHAGGSGVEHINKDRWLLTYADMMNNLLILFIVLYAISVTDAAKFESIAKNFSHLLQHNSATSSDIGEINSDIDWDNMVIPSDLNSLGSGNSVSGGDEFDELYDKVQTTLVEKGYEDSLSVEKSEGYIYFRFKDSILFYPDQSVMRPGATEALAYVGEVIASVNDLVEAIDIGGHTADVGNTGDSFFSWELSSDRSITVLRYLVQNCGLPQSKMSIAGYSHYKAYVDQNTESGRALNRRVEIRISKADPEAKTINQADDVTESQ